VPALLVPGIGDEPTVLPAARPLPASPAPCANKFAGVARITIAAITAVAIVLIITTSFLLLTAAQGGCSRSKACARNKPDQWWLNKHPPRCRSRRRLRKLIAFDDDTFDKLRQLARDRMATFQELADEAFADVLKKHGIPIDLKDALRKSAAASKTPVPDKKKSGKAKP
jgi:hypothetical protein